MQITTTDFKKRKIKILHLYGTLALDYIFELHVTTAEDI